MKRKVNSCVLDASALLTLLNNEPGAHVVEQRLDDCWMSAANMSEVIAKLADQEMPQAEIQEALAGLGIHIAPLDEEAALVAGMLRPLTRHLDLSFADRACLSLGHTMQVPIITTDKQWLKLRLKVRVEIA